ncbi:MAG: carboxylating nicotinate-nucleotide diphosphorylase [Gammaproteobacteria bacterium]|jgi:nicotinate-nucleotide pyrophosphorylase (carboxylating)|nr:carboxylating nicotinate-nucleotide diphosphorylase [Gammaproteobacteria bacterium]
MATLASDIQQSIRTEVAKALREDVGPGDLTAGLVPADRQGRAEVLCREAAVICGQHWFTEAFRQCDPSIAVTWDVAEGAAVAANTRICCIAGPARAMLTAERTALNFLQTLSGTATLARRYSDAVSHTATRVLDTRKTLPGLRRAQKYAVTVGGANNHRIGLFDAILIKENHIIACGGIAAAVERALQAAPDVLVEVEVETLDEARQALAAGAQRLLLDNFELDQLRAAVALRDAERSPASLEASGGVTLDNIAAIAETGVDFISVGAITKDVKAIDFSMRFTLL